MKMIKRLKYKINKGKFIINFCTLDLEKWRNFLIYGSSSLSDNCFESNMGWYCGYEKLIWKAAVEWWHKLKIFYNIKFQRIELNLIIFTQLISKIAKIIIFLL